MDDLLLERASIGTLAMERECSMEEAKALWKDQAPALKEKRRDKLRVIGQWLAACGVLSTAACAGSPPPEPRIVTQRVEVPVPVRCEPKLQRPAGLVTDAQVKAAAGPEDLLLMLERGRIVAAGWIGRLEAAVTGCGGTISGP